MAASPLVFDTGPLSHFATAGWLGVLKAIVGNRGAIIPETVVSELQRGLQTNQRLQQVLDADWILHRPLTDTVELQAYSRYRSILASGNRNLGEVAVLAVAQTLPATAVIDDAAGRKTAQDNNISLRPTLTLLCDAIREGLLTLQLVSALADDLLASHYRLPFTPGGFEQWAIENNMFDS